MDQDGYAQFASIGNLARRAVVSLDEARAAVQTLEGPDPDSSDPDNDGKRIERVPGGWVIFNAGKHRDIATREGEREANRQRAAKYRARRKVTPAVTETVTGNAVVTPTVTRTAKSNARVPPLEVEADATVEAPVEAAEEVGRGLYRNKEEGDQREAEVTAEVEADGDDLRQFDAELAAAERRAYLDSFDLTEADDERE